MKYLRLLAPVRYPLLAVLALLVLLPGISRIPPSDRDESRYAEATVQMLDTGNYVDVRFQDAPRYLQPAGIYWLQAAAVSALGGDVPRAIWKHRVVSAAGAVGAVLLTCRIAGVLYGPLAGLVAGALMALSLLLGVEARMAKIDATLLLTILAAQAALLEVWRKREVEPAPRVAPWLFWVFNGLGLMLKGPLILLVTFGTLLGLVVGERRVRWMKRLHPGWGVLVMVAIVLPWLAGITWVSGGHFFSDAIGHNLIGKLGHGQQAHGAPPGTYLALFILTFWPGSLFLPRLLGWLRGTWRTPQVVFLLAWIVPTWAVFEAVATKLPHYVLPTYPAIATLMAAALLAERPAPGTGRMARLGGWLALAWSTLWAFAGAVLAVVGPALLLFFESRFDPWAWLAAAVALAALGLAWHAQRRAAPRPALAAAAVAAAALWVSSFFVVLPQLSTIWLSPRLAETFQEVKPCPDSVLASASYAEPSLVYLVGRETRLISAPDAAAFLAADRACGVALVAARDEDAFRTRADALGLPLQALGKVDGLNYSNGRRLALTFYAAPPPPPQPESQPESGPQAAPDAAPGAEDEDDSPVTAPADPSAEPAPAVPAPDASPDKASPDKVRQDRADAGRGGAAPARL